MVRGHYGIQRSDIQQSSSSQDAGHLPATLVMVGSGYTVPSIVRHIRTVATLSEAAGGLRRGQGNLGSGEDGCDTATSPRRSSTALHMPKLPALRRVPYTLEPSASRNIAFRSL